MPLHPHKTLDTTLKPQTASSRMVPSDSLVSLVLSLRRSRLAVLVGFAMVLVSIVTVAFAHGTELVRFNRKQVSIAEQEQLLDRYNSYSGNIASAFGRLLEVFVALMAQVVVLWVMTDSVFSMWTNWRVKMTVLILGASVGFLLTNSLNALNVQVRELPPTIVMSASDLSVPINITGSSTVAKTFSERTASNPSTNTILRSLILPRAAIKSTCTTKDSMYYSLQADGVIYGMPQRPWMKDFIPNALPASSVWMDLLSNQTTATVHNFPTNASIIADLLISGVATYSKYGPFDAVTPFNLKSDAEKWYPDSDVVTREGGQTRGKIIPTARLAGLLPPDPTSSEAQDREWLLARTTAFLWAVTPTEWHNMSTLWHWTLNISRINITQSVWIDSVTLESDMIYVNQSNISIYTSTTGHKIINFDGPYPFNDGRNPDAQIHTYAICSNDDGTETLYSTLVHNDFPNNSHINCHSHSNSSMYVFSSGRHLSAESIGEGQAKNLRVVYSATFARISWQLQDLSTLYGAECNVTNKDGGCMGLDAALKGTNQRLLVSANALPQHQLASVVYNSKSENPSYYIFPQQPLEIVSVRRPTELQQRRIIEHKSSSGRTFRDFTITPIKSEMIESWLGDVLLPHNIAKNTTWTPYCHITYDRRVQNYVNNHIYMETTLQPTYTAAAFFLFQNGMAREILNSTASSTSVPLHLDNNVKEMSVWLSVPTLNAFLTLAGCIGLVTALVVALVRLHFATETQLTITVPHQIARVMVDDTTFPSLLLKRQLTTNSEEGEVDEYFIHTLTVRPNKPTTIDNGIPMVPGA